MRLWIKRMVAMAAAGAAASLAHVEGFATRDLTPFAGRVAEALGGSCQTAAEPERLTLMCTSAGNGPLIDIFIKRRDPGDRIEQDIRSGKTGKAELEVLCKKLNPDCTVSMLDVAPAVGWVGAQPMRRQALSTAVIVRDGDQLTVRALAADPNEARADMEKALAVVRPVIGP